MTDSAASMRLALVIGKKGAVLPDRTVWNRLIIDLLKAEWRVEIYSWQESFNKSRYVGQYAPSRRTEDKLR